MRANFLVVFVFLAAIALVLQAGCGQKSAVKDIKNFTQETVPSNGEAKSAFDPYALNVENGVNIEGFTLWVMDESNQPNAELTTLYSLSEKTLEDGQKLLSISVHGSPGIPHSLLYLRYDQTLINPKTIEIADFFGKKSEYISFVTAYQPGIISIAIAKIHPENGMPSGDGAIATITFEPKPFDTSYWRVPAKAPGGEENRVIDFYARPSRNKITLTWTEVNVGDYDNSGDVGIPDITPIAQRFGYLVGDGVEDQIDSYVDGDKNGEVGISDITPIAENYLAVISGYRIYRTTDTSGSIDYPDPYIGSDSGPVTLGRQDPPPDNRKPTYVYIDEAVTPEYEYNYKVVPYDMGEDVEGAPSKNAYVVVSDIDQQPPIWFGAGGVSDAIPGDGIIKVYFGAAYDNDSPPVRYSLLYSEGVPIDQSNEVKEIRGIESSPFYLGSDPAHDITNGMMYYIGVRAYDLMGNETGWSPVVTATPDTGLTTDIAPPVWDDENKIGAYQITSGDGQLRVDFGSATDVDSSPVVYTVYWQLGNTGVNKADPTGKYFGAANPFVIQDLANDELYSILVTASDSATPANETTNLEYMVGMPTTGGNPDLDAPVWRDSEEVGIKDVVAGDSNVRVSWYLADDAVSPPATYNVYWEQNDDTPPLDYEAAVLAGRVLTGLDGDNVLVTGLVNGRLYRFSVRAQDASTPPNITQNTESRICAPTPSGDTNPPEWTLTAGIQNVNPGDRKAILSWGNATDLEGNGVSYNYYWEVDDGSGPVDYAAARTATPKRFANTSGTGAIVYNLTNNTTYRFAVRAIDNLGNEDSNEISLTATPEYTRPFDAATVDDVGDTGYMPSIAMAPDKSFGVAYFDKMNGCLKYASAASRDGTWTIEVLDDPAAEIHGAYPSVAFDSQSHPHIAFLDWTHAEDAVPGTRVLYITSDGTDWSGVETVATAGFEGYDDFYGAPRIALSPFNNPYIACVDTTTEEVVIANRVSASNWNIVRPFPSGPGVELRDSLRTDIVFFDPGTGTTFGFAFHEPTSGATFAYYDTVATDYFSEVIGSGNPYDGLYIDLAVDGRGDPIATWMDDTNNPFSLPKYAERNGADDWTSENVDAPFTDSGYSPGIAVKSVTGVPAGMPAVAWFVRGTLGGRFALDDLGNEGFQTPDTFDVLATGDNLLLGMCADNANGLPGKCVIAYTAPNGALGKLNIAVEN